MIYATPPSFRAGDRVEWNPTGDVWNPGNVHRVDPGSVLLALDENGQTLWVSPKNLRQLCPTCVTAGLPSAADLAEWAAYLAGES